MLYQGYRLGHWLALRLPVAVSYWIAVRFADLQYWGSSTDRQAVRRNVAAILGPDHPELSRTVREVFRNFAKYLVDFFRLERVDQRFINRRVTVEGREHVDAARRRGKGVIILSAHVGNYELGAALAATGGYPMSAIVLTHQDPRVDAFFTGQRLSRGVRSIPVGMGLRQGFACLKRNELLGILADRDFFNSGIRLPFLGRTMSVPTGPALFGLRTGASLVPTFLVRDAGDRFRLIFDQPIEPVSTGQEPQDVARLTADALAVLERYIRRYPDQWYLFRDFEHPGPGAIQ